MASRLEAIGARDAVAITKSNTTVYNEINNGGYIDALYVGGSGDVAVRTIPGTSVTFSGASAGQIIPIRCDQVLSTGTTATNIVGLRF